MCTYRVYSCQIDPRSRYHSMSLSLREYSARSTDAEAGADRRRLRETNSMASMVIRERLVFLFLANREAGTRRQVHRRQKRSDRTVYKRS